ncbi:MAG: MerR family transcriptional regulator [Candidatus Pelagibacter sp.]
MVNKLNIAYKTIGEVAELLNLKNKKKGKLNTYVIRFWEKEFKQIKPKLLNNNRRYYDKKTVDLLIKIKFLLKDKGMTIKGVKMLLNDKRFDLDDTSNVHINVFEKNLKKRLNKISVILKDLKKKK